MKNQKVYKNNKGFTLVELIVVIVILAILAAILIPGLLKWIDEAKDKQYQLEARSIYMATQAVIAKEYSGTIEGETWEDSNDTATAPAKTKRQQVAELAGLTTVANVEYEVDANGVITTFTTIFTSSDATPIEAVWNSTNQAWSITKNPTF